MIHSTLKSLQVKLLLTAITMISFSCHSGNTVTLTTQSASDEPTVVVACEVQEIEPGLRLEDLTLEEKVAQMFIVHPEELSPTNPTIAVDDTMISRLQKCPVGGILFFGANIKTPEQLKKFTKEFKEACQFPPFIAIDEEGGTVARIGRNENFNVERVPSMIEIGNTGDTSKAFEVGSTIGDYLNDYGINLNLAPIADIYSNPNNKVIGKRAFGTTAEACSPMVGACCDGMHSQGILVALKHFPGHGDTDTDSHSSLPTVSKTWDELLNLEIIPFKENFDKADMIMIAHIAVTKVNEEINGKTAPSTLSYNMLTDKLRNELGYEGIIITDALRMQAVTNFFESQGEAAIQAVKAGNDIILCPAKLLAEDGPYYSIIKAVRNGEISEDRINESVQRILNVKNKWNK